MANMDEPEVVPEPESPPPEAETAAAPPKPRRGRGWLLFLLLLILLAVAGWFAWQWWQQRNVEYAVSRAQEQRSAQREQGLSTLQAQVDAFGNQLETLRTSNEALRAKFDDGDASKTALRQQVAGMEVRIGRLEAALVDLSQQQLTGRDRILVNEAEMLLQLGQHRYELFGDATAAAEAFALADRSLAALGSPRFASVRQSIQSERAALAASQPVARSNALKSLQQLRARWQALPLKSPQLDQTITNTGQSVWRRVGNTLASLVRVRRESKADPVKSMDVSLARQLGALNLAQAQAALLASDSAGFRSALERSESLIKHAFDADAPAVRQVRSELQRLQASVDRNAAPAQLGASLHALRNLRAIGAMTRDAKAPAASDPEPSSTAPGPTPATAGSAA